MMTERATSPDWRSATVEDIAEKVAMGPFESKMARLSKQWREQQAETRRLDAAIKESLAKLGFGGGE